MYELTSTTDFNTLGFGVYYTFSSTIASNCQNSPLPGNGGSLAVISLVMGIESPRPSGIQLCFREIGNTNTDGLYVRYALYYQSSWTAWKKIA